VYKILLSFTLFIPSFIKSADHTKNIFFSSGNDLVHAAEKIKSDQTKRLEFYYGALSLYTTAYHQEQCPVFKISMHHTIKQLHIETQNIIKQRKESDKTSDYVLSLGWNFVEKSVRNIINTPINVQPLLERLHKEALRQQTKNMNLTKKIKFIEQCYHKIEDPYNKQIIAGHLLRMINLTQHIENQNITINPIPIIQKSKQLLEHSKPISNSLDLPEEFLSEVTNQYYYDLWNMWYGYQQIENIYDRYQISKNIALLLPFINSLRLDEPSWDTLKNLWTHHLVSTQDILVHLHIPLIEKKHDDINQHTLDILNNIYEEPVSSIEEKEHALIIAYQIIYECDSKLFTKSQKHLWEKRFNKIKSDPDHTHFYTTQIHSLIGDRYYVEKKFNNAKTRYFASIEHADLFLKTCQSVNESEQMYTHIKHICLKLMLILEKSIEDETISFSIEEFNVLEKSAHITNLTWLLDRINYIKWQPHVVHLKHFLIAYKKLHSLKVLTKEKPDQKVELLT
jgi:hypothetical protein